MSIAPFTLDFYSSHTETQVLFFCYVVHLICISALQFSRITKTRPAASGLKFVLGSKERNFATDANVGSFLGVFVDPGARERPFRAFLPSNMVLGGRQDDTPFVLGHVTRPFLGLCPQLIDFG